jgi:signal transduction histidine kinase
LKSQFLSVATHELRTPLSVMLGYNSMLADSLEERLNPEERQVLRDSIAACKRLIRLVNSMLDITQIESGKMRMNYTLADIREVVNGVVTLFQQEAGNRHVHLGLELPAHVPRFKFDPERIEQVLINLVGNALKFTPGEGHVVVAVRPRLDSQEIEISVSDTGIGIPVEDQQKVFDEFAQVRRQIKGRQREGSGLGLAIVKRIVEAHAATIELHSAPGQGSTFSFVLPMKIQEWSLQSALTA